MKYLVGLLVGGLMEDPQLCFNPPYDIIEGDNREECLSIYNKKHNCFYFYGSIMCSLHEDGIIGMISKYCSEDEIDKILLNNIAIDI